MAQRTQKEVTHELAQLFSSHGLMLATPVRALIMLRAVNKPLFDELVSVGVDSNAADEGMIKLGEVAGLLARITSDFDVSGKRPKGVPKELEHQCTSGYIRFGRLGKGDDYTNVYSFAGVRVSTVRDFCTGLLQDQISELSVGEGIATVAADSVGG